MDSCLTEPCSLEQSKQVCLYSHNFSENIRRIKCITNRNPYFSTSIRLLTKTKHKSFCFLHTPLLFTFQKVYRQGLPIWCSCFALFRPNKIHTSSPNILRKITLTVSSKPWVGVQSKANTFETGDVIGETPARCVNPTEKARQDQYWELSYSLQNLLFQSRIHNFRDQSPPR